MGYDIYSFYDLIEEIPRFEQGMNGKKYLKLCMENEANRLPIESFIGMKLESTITKVSSKPFEYLKLYLDYKSIVTYLQKTYENSITQDPPTPNIKNS